MNEYIVQNVETGQYLTDRLGLKGPLIWSSIGDAVTVYYDPDDEKSLLDQVRGTVEGVGREELKGTPVVFHEVPWL